MIQRFGIQIFCPEHQLFRIQQLGTDDGEDELFKGHAVVGKKAAQGKGKRCQDTHPADFSAPHYIAQAEIHAHSHSHGQQGKNELPQGQPEKQALLVVPDFFVDTDFYRDHHLSKLICGNIRVMLICGRCIP